MRRVKKDKYQLVALVWVMLMIGVTGCSGKLSSDKTWQQDQETTQQSMRKRAGLLNVELGLGYLEQGQVSRAKKKLVHALEIAPTLPEAHSAMGYFFERVGDLGEAEREYKKALSYGNGQGSFYNNYGTFLCRTGKFVEADAAFMKALLDKQYPNTGHVYENAGICALDAGQKDKAKKYFDIAVRRDPSRNKAQLQLAQLAFESGEVAEAKQYLAQHNQHAVHTPQAIWLGIQIAKKMGDEDLVVSQGLLLKSLFSESSEYKQYLLGFKDK